MSDLLNKASLVMIPSGYKEDVVYSAVPTDGSGDLSFSRASNGTRINSAGLVEVCPWNLVGYSETFDNSGWVKNDSTITANATTAPNGTLTADKLIGTNSTSQKAVYQGLSLTGTNTFFCYCKSAEFTTASLKLDAGITSLFNLSTGTVTSQTNCTASIESVGDGWYKCSITTSNNISYAWIAINSGNTVGDGTKGIYIWGAQVNIGSTAKPYFPTTDRLNVPRLTYQNGGGGCPSLLLEKQSTNYALSSEDFANTTYWTASGNMTVTANQATSPDGTQNADLMFDSGVRLKFVNSPVSSYYTFSCYFKRVDVQNVRITASDGTTGDVAATFNLINLTSSSSTAGDWSNKSTQITSVGNGWYRCSVTALRGAGGSQIGYRIECSESAKSFYAWGYQAEAGAYPTTYIPTTSASATRVADACFKTGIGSLIGQTEGVFFLDFQKTNNDNTGTGGYFRIDVNDGTTSNRILFGFDLNKVNATVITSGSVVALIETPTTRTQERIKAAIAYKANDFVLYVNGVQIGADTSGAVPSNMANFQWGVNQTTPTTTTGIVNEQLFFKTRLTNDELISLTTL